MAGIPVIGDGPVAITTKDGAHMTIPLGALSLDSNNQIVVGTWPPYSDLGSDPAFKASVDGWLKFLVGQGELKPATSGAKAPAGPAFLVEATHVGATGNDIKLKISHVNPQVPPDTTTLDLEVSVVNTYTGLTLATIADTIGTSDGGGSKPGLVFLAAPAPPLAHMPDAGVVHMTGLPPHADVMSGTDLAFTLGARPDGGGGTFDVEVTVHLPDTFDLKVTWTKPIANKTLLQHAAQFAYIVNIIKPPGGFGVPDEVTVTLSDGANPGTVSVPPKPAKASAPPA